MNAFSRNDFGEIRAVRDMLGTHFSFPSQAVKNSSAPHLQRMRFGVQGLGFGVWDLGFTVWDLGFRVYMVWGLRLGVWGLGFRVSD